MVVYKGFRRCFNIWSDDLSHATSRLHEICNKSYWEISNVPESVNKCGRNQHHEMGGICIMLILNFVIINHRAHYMYWHWLNIQKNFSFMGKWWDSVHLVLSPIVWIEIRCIMHYAADFWPAYNFGHNISICAICLHFYYKTKEEMSKQ